ncbi:hypothetical protein MC885_016592 [Smutsia gigantea]|nr:hypothetical protein MC885_016592 [Smutsia gigantea]
MRSQGLRRPLSPAPQGRRVSGKTPGVETLLRGLGPRRRNRVPPRSWSPYSWGYRGWSGCEAPLGPAGAGRPGSRTPPGLSSTEVQGVAEGAAPAAASPFTVLVMRPCGGQDEPAAEGVVRQAPALGGSAGAPSYLCEGAGAGGEETGEDEADLLDAADAPGGGESAASLEDLEDEELHSGGEGGPGGARRRGSGGGCVSKTCTYEGCSETTSQVAKQRKPWMCKKHRNKMYKDKYKKKKSDQAQNCGGAAPAGGAGSVKLEESADNILCIVKPRTGSFGDRPARPTLLEQVLNQKRLSLLRSPEVVQFLQKQQQLLNQQVLEQRQQQFPGTSV